MNRGWHLGFVYNSNGELINHRPLLKVIINPFLRPFGQCIASDINYENMTVKYCFINCEHVSLFHGLKEMRYDLPDEYTVKKLNILY